MYFKDLDQEVHWNKLDKAFENLESEFIDQNLTQQLEEIQENFSIPNPTEKFDHIPSPTSIIPLSQSIEIMIKGPPKPTENIISSSTEVQSFTRVMNISRDRQK